MAGPGDDVAHALGGLAFKSGGRLQKRLQEAVQGEYEVIRPIGRGGMGVVFLARDIALGRDVAIKVLLADLFGTAVTVERFKREARTAAALSHPNIVAVHAVREHDELVFFVMQFVEGHNLEELIAQNGPMAPEKVVDVLVHIGGALDHAHSRGVVHRDIKPANIIVDNHGWSFVMDFGIAKVAEPGNLTVPGCLVGTPKYASPEQCRAEPAVPASDQYSLGAMLYELLVGKPPFVAATLSQMIDMHLKQPPVPIRELRPDVPPLLAEVVHRMLAKTVDERWPSMAGALLHLGITSRTMRGSSSSSQISVAPASFTPVPEPLPAQGKARLLKLVLPIGVGLAVLAGVLITRGGGPAVPVTATDSVKPVTDSTARPAPPVDSTPVAPPVATRPPVESTVSRATKPVSKPPQQAVVKPEPVPAPAPATPAPSASVAADSGRLVLGTRGVEAVLYVNGQAIGAVSRLRTLMIPAGTQRLSLRSEGCIAWDSTVTVPANGEVRIGYRQPNCDGAGQ